MDDAQLATQTRFWVSQKFTLMVNRYTVSVAGHDGSIGEEVCFVEQKRMAFKEEVTFHRGGAPYFRFKARRVMDLGATYDVMTMDGTPIGLFRKDFGKSLLRSTWHLEQPGLPEVTGQERSLAVAILRRAQDTIPLPFHFDFTAPDGQPVMALSRKIALRDKYLLEVPHPALDRRLAIAMAVALDALQSR
ncbi:MAG TPA: hypothetical protein VFG13_05085 [Blastococcus sp.]|nr:hypothetical protein [Blastococcus sp.]